MPRSLLAVLAAAIFACGLAVGGAHADPYHDGMTAYDRGDYKAAIALWRPLADKGDADAMFNVGILYDNGKGVPHDAAEAARWFRKAAEQGQSKAQFNLAVDYATGEGVAKDEAEAA